MEQVRQEAISSTWAGDLPTADLGAGLLRRARRTTVRHVLAVRTSLERDAAVAAARGRTDADVAAIRAAADARRVACDDPDRARSVAADVAFHVRVHVHVRC